MYDFFEKPIAGPSADVVLMESAENKSLDDWSRDNRFILYAVQGHQHAARNLWALPLAGDRKPFAVTTSLYDEINGRLSSDGHWVVYQSNEAGEYDVYLRPFPGPGRAWRISTNGGTWPAWRRDGREIFYLGPDNSVMAVPITLAFNGATVERGTPVALFSTRPGSTFEPSPDGQRFLVNAVIEDPPTPPIVVILNWAGRKK
jgi:hypothetical protein